MRPWAWLGPSVLVLVTACGVDGSASPPGAGPSAPTIQPSPTGISSPSSSSRSSSAQPTPSDPGEPTPTPTKRPKATATAKPPSLDGDRENAFAFAPLDDLGDVTVEGRVPNSPAWSTSKVLVVAAYLDTAAGGDLDRVSNSNRRLIKAALTESDADAVVAIRNQIPGRPGPAMTKVLRSIGDQSTTAPDNYQGLMPWSVREQVRFMGALAKGKVVSRAASDYLLTSMRPIPAHAWGLGAIGATAYKGGWLRSDTVTRQMGIVDDYAVAIITDGVGPAVRQTDGDSAHVQQLNRLARMLEKRLAYEESQ
jgi:hypothetical protein